MAWVKMLCVVLNKFFYRLVMKDFIRCPKCEYVRTDSDINPDWQCPACHIAYSKFTATGERLLRKYVPNFIPFSDRIFNIAASFFLLIYGTYGLMVNDIYIPGKRSRGIHFYDENAIMVYAAFICASIVMISVVIGHYDQRDNEHRYKAVGRFFKISGWVLFFIACVLSLFVPHEGA